MSATSISLTCSKAKTSNPRLLGGLAPANVCPGTPCSDSTPAASAEWRAQSARPALAAVVTPTEMDPTFPEGDELEARLGGRLNLLALSTAITAGSAEAVREVELRRKLPDIGRAVLAAAARSSCVIYAPAAFAALGQHPSAIHVRVHAPIDWRIAAYQREHVVDRRSAEKALNRDDHRKQAWVRSLYGLDIDDPRFFSVVLDASRFSRERLVETLLAAGGAVIERAPPYSTVLLTSFALQR
jgi:Cytidylate kinase-like family